LVFVDDSIGLVPRILHLSIYQHVVLLFDHVSLERVVAHLSVLTDLAIRRKPSHGSLVRLELTAGALLA
jgi:hypothetical protein